jgi:hypothetical protein
MTFQSENQFMTSTYKKSLLIEISIVHLTMNKEIIISKNTLMIIMEVKFIIIAII